MTGFRKLLFISLFIACIFNISAQTRGGAETIPDFTLFRQDRTTFTQNDLDSKKLLFFLFFDVNCEHCRHAVQTINKRYSEMTNTMIHLITLDPPNEIFVFLNKYGKNLIDKKNVMLFYDLRNEFIIKFKPRKYPSIFLYTPDKKLVLYDDNPENLPKFFKEIKSRSK